MTTNTRPCTCRRCGQTIQPGQGQPAPDDLPVHVGDYSKKYCCQPCYTWCADYVISYAAAAANYKAIALHIRRITPELITINQLGQAAPVHSQAAAWVYLYQTVQSAGLYCDRLAETILDHLAIKTPSTYGDFKITIDLCKFAIRS